MIFILALWLSSLLNLRGINYILSYVVEWGVLALFVVFQPELRRALAAVQPSIFRPTFQIFPVAPEVLISRVSSVI